MKNLFSFSLLFFLLTKVFCQVEDSPYKNWMIGVELEPAYTYRILNYNSDNSWIQELRENQEIPAFGFSAGLLARYYINEKWSLEGGFQYANRAFTIQNENLSWFIANEDFPTKSKTRFAFHYVEIPVKANNHWKVGKIELVSSIGISLNNFNHKKTIVTTFFKNEKSNKEKSKNNFAFKDTYSILLGIGANLPLSDNFHLYFGPTYRQNFISITKKEIGSEYINSLGFNTKLLLRIKKIKR